MRSLLAGLNTLRASATGGQVKEYQRFLPQPFRAGEPIFEEWNADRAVKYAFKVSTWVYRCVQMTMESGSTVPFGVQQFDAKTRKWEWSWDHDISRVLGDWNDDFSPQESMAMCLAWLQLGGNALAAKYLIGRKLKQLVAESPVGVRPIPNGLGGIEQYEYTSGSSVKRWDAADLCHARLVDPQNRFWGMSRLVAIARAVDTDVEAVKWNKRRIELGGVPDGILIDKSLVTNDQRREAQKDIDETWRDTAGPFVTGDGVDWIQLGLSQNDMQFLAGRQFTMREIVIGFGFNPALFGEDATYNNSEIAERAKWTGAIIPLLNVLAQSFTRGLIDKNRRGQERIWYDLSHVEALKDDVKGKIENARTLVSIGTPYDEAKDFVGLALEDLAAGLGKVSMVNAGMVLLADVVNVTTDTPEEPEVPEATPAPAADPAAPAVAEPAVVPLAPTAAPSTSLNGAQVTALFDLCVAVQGGFPRDSAIAIAVVAFSITEDAADKIIPAQGEAKPEPESTPPPAKPAPKPAAEDDEAADDDADTEDE